MENVSPLATPVYNSRPASPTSIPPLGHFVPASILRASPGDLIEIDRKIHSQWVLSIGEGKVIYVAGDKVDIPLTGEARVKRSTLTVVAKDCLVRVNNKVVPAKERNLSPLDTRIVIENAKKQLAKKVEFNLFEKNSEYYVTKWKFGQGWSNQADTAHQVMSVFNSQQKKLNLSSCRHSAPGSLHAMVTGLAAIFQTNSKLNRTFASTNTFVSGKNR